MGSLRRSCKNPEETTLHYGGAQYIPTGRGLATQREAFLKSASVPVRIRDAGRGGWAVLVV